MTRRYLAGTDTGIWLERILVFGWNGYWTDPEVLPDNRGEHVRYCIWDIGAGKLLKIPKKRAKTTNFVVGAGKNVEKVQKSAV